MDLGLRGRKALICGASEGIGYASAKLLAADGVNLVLVARNEERLEKSAALIRQAHDVNVNYLAVDLGDRDGRARLLSYCSDPDILIHNGGWPRTGTDFRAWTYEEWLRAIDLMMLAPVELITGVIDGMAERRFGRIVAVTSRFVKEPKVELSLSVSPRLGLTGFMVGLSKKFAPHNVTLNTAMPGIIATETQLQHGRDLAAAAGKTFEEIWAERSSTNSANRFATPEEFASLCVFLCAANSGFLTGQNILSDGGGFPGVF